MVTINGGVDSKKICTQKRTLLLVPTQRHDSKKTVKEIAKMKLFLLVFGSGCRPEAGISVLLCWYLISCIEKFLEKEFLLESSNYTRSAVSTLPNISDRVFKHLW